MNSSMTSSEADDHQYEGGGPQGGPSGQTETAPVVVDAQKLLTTLYEARNPYEPNKFDFTDNETGYVKEFFGDGMSKEAMLQMIKDTIAELEDHIKTQEQL